MSPDVAACPIHPPLGSTRCVVAELHALHRLHSALMAARIRAQCLQRVASLPPRSHLASRRPLNQAAARGCLLQRGARLASTVSGVQRMAAVRHAPMRGGTGSRVEFTRQGMACVARRAVSTHASAAGAADGAPSHPAKRDSSSPRSSRVDRDRHHHGSRPPPPPATPTRRSVPSQRPGSGGEAGVAANRGAGVRRRPRHRSDPLGVVRDRRDRLVEEVLYPVDDGERLLCRRIACVGLLRWHVSCALH